MEKGNIVSLEDRVPKLKQQRRKKANRRLIFLLLIFFFLIACVSYFQSPLSRVKTIVITGNHVYNTQEIINKSKLTTKQNIWSINKESMKKNIKKLPEIKSIEIQVSFPQTVKIEVDEFKRIAYFFKDTAFYPILENGKILNQNKLEMLPVNAPILKGFSEGKVLKEMVKSLNELPPEVVNSISEIHYTPHKTDKYHINLFLNEGYEVSATIRTFSKKMSHYPSILSQLDPKVKGIIDLEVGSYFKAYELEGEEAIEDQGER